MKRMLLTLVPAAAFTTFPVRFAVAQKAFAPSGTTNAWIWPDIRQFGDDAEGSVEGSPPSDLGFMRPAAMFARMLKPLLQPGK